MEMRNSWVVKQIKRLLSNPRHRQLAAWAAAVGLAAIVTAIGRHLQINSTSISQLAWLFIIDSVIFLAIYRDYPKVGVVMILFLYALELSTLGYFVFAAATIS